MTYYYQILVVHFQKVAPFYPISATNAKVKAVMEDMNEDTVGTTKFYYEIFHNSIST